MNGTSFLADTNVILFLLKGNEKIAHVLQDKQVYISFITELELFSFKQLNSVETNRITNFLSECIIIDINPQIKELAVNIRKDYSTKLPDAIIAATAQFLSIPLLTYDRDFSKIKELEILFFEK
jgi:predicted nucleic acid-binding protein